MPNINIIMSWVLLTLFWFCKPDNSLFNPYFVMLRILHKRIGHQVMPRCTSSPNYQLRRLHVHTHIDNLIDKYWKYWYRWHIDLIWTRRISTVWKCPTLWCSSPHSHGSLKRGLWPLGLYVSLRGPLVLCSRALGQHRQYSDMATENSTSCLIRRACHCL